MRKNLLSLFFLLLVPGLLLGQSNFKIKGKVTDAKTGEALIGALVMLKPLNLGGATDLNGNYSFDVPTNVAKGQTAELTASYVNYKKKTVKVILDGKDVTQNFVLQEDIFQNEEIVVSGIASKTAKSVAEIAVGRVSASELSEINTYGGLSQLVGGKIAGVQLETSSGNVGGGFRFYVRSGGGINGNEQPVIYLDGVRINDSETGFFGVGGQSNSALASINPDDIANIEVLKGPAAASSYGVNGSNGVILITTKSGRAALGGTGISANYKFTYGFNEQSKKYSTDIFKSAEDANKTFVTGYIRENSIDIAGGGSQLRYYGGFSSRNEGGIQPNNNLQRKSASAKITAYPNDKLTLQFAGTFNYTDINRGQNDNNILGFLGNTLLFPTSYRFTDSLAILGLTDISRTAQFIGSVSATYTPIKDLEINAGFGIDNSSIREDRTFPANLKYSGRTRGERDAYDSNNRQFTYDLNARYRYSLFDDIKVTSVVGLQLFNRTFRSAFVQTQTFATELITDLGAGSLVAGYGENFFNTRDAGIFTENSLSYMDTYFLTLKLRQDYASSIGADAPSVIYPGASFAVRLDRLGVVPTDIFNLLKFRVAYGESGLLPLSTDAIPLLWTATSGAYGGGATLISIGNAAIEPERIKEFEFGIDAELFNMFSLELTYYIQSAEKSIVGFNNPPSTGLTASSVPFNIGKIKGSGFESLLQAKLLNSQDYALDLGFIWNYQTNEVVDLGGAQPIFDGFSNNVIKEGLRKHEFYREVVNGAKFDANGKYIGVDVQTTRTALGNPIPTHTGSFTINFKFLKNFYFYVLTDWALDRKMFNDTQLFAARFGNYVPRINLGAQIGIGTVPGITPYAVGTPEYIAAANAYAKTDGNYPSNYIVDAQFLKLREISISYSFKDFLPDLGQTYVKDLVLGISGRNLWTSTPYTGADVELNHN
ncbi:MAG: TonB-dependent receptor, partial [Bacteroidetes bacterium]|nr:TonB-dependent receptor [Bacteroidota bacterium]